ncbi:D-amino acid dehydrogenase small subunit [Vibrio casei]|uniref:D-amino acid dehydrogenase n=2 Tax=Vibrionaceae TaxID=641 RepID=A0A368LN63_9VIBR|nr:MULTISPECIES: D-amino acid dehydrogenase [Vibrio]RCS73287.1 D-amino acid dehydrogenase [Vibrio casei]SJN18200.1 D-amino acid dehydrogenase small subunit [Vibrio casei]HBV75758.1 D-amino acid dehydrogenase [Vibrio sp.]
MHITVLGGGVLGVATAWYLANSGHQVTVIDRQDSVAEETSHGNAGMISPGYSSPWAAPGVPFKAIGWMMQDLSPFMINMKELDGYTLSWMSKMLANCNTKSYQVNKARMLRVAEYSRDCFIALRKELNLNYDGRQKGTLQLFRKQKQIDALQKDISVLKQLGIEHQALDMQGCIEHEPALANVKDKFVGGLRLPGDETGDCYKFTTELAAQCEALGVTFMLNTNIEHLVESNGKIVSVKTDKGVVKADTFVCALGSYSPKLMKPLGIDLPIYPIKGYSLTLPIEDESRAPQSTIMDETYKVAVTRFEDRIRVGGTAEIASFNLERPLKRRASIDFVIQDMFPGAADVAKAEFWCGLRPMTPDSTPILGGTKYSNLYMNTGHGTLGWTMSLGSAKFVADIINNKQPDINPEGLSIERYYG